MRTIRSLQFVAPSALLVALVAILVGAAPATAREVDRRVVTFGETRQELKSKPMTERPNRPLHVYGNTVRRRAHR